MEQETNLHGSDYLGSWGVTVKRIYGNQTMLCYWCHSYTKQQEPTHLEGSQWSPVFLFSVKIMLLAGTWKAQMSLTTQAQPVSGTANKLIWVPICLCYSFSSTSTLLFLHLVSVDCTSAEEVTLLLPKPSRVLCSLLDFLCAHRRGNHTDQFWNAGQCPSKEMHLTQLQRQTWTLTFRCPWKNEVLLHSGSAHLLCLFSIGALAKNQRSGSLLSTSTWKWTQRQTYQQLFFSPFWLPFTINS